MNELQILNLASPPLSSSLDCSAWITHYHSLPHLWTLVNLMRTNPGHFLRETFTESKTQTLCCSRTGASSSVNSDSYSGPCIFLGGLFVNSLSSLQTSWKEDGFSLIFARNMWSTLKMNTKVSSYEVCGGSYSILDLRSIIWRYSWGQTKNSNY